MKIDVYKNDSYSVLSFTASFKDIIKKGDLIDITDKLKIAMIDHIKREGRFAERIKRMRNNKIKYMVSFGEETFMYSEEELKNFIEVAVIKNKDIANFSVRRIIIEN